MEIDNDIVECLECCNCGDNVSELLCFKNELYCMYCLKYYSSICAIDNKINNGDVI